MEAALAPPVKQGTYTIRVDGWEIQEIRPVMTEEEFFAFCLKNPDMRIEQDKHGNIIIMSPVSYFSGNQESEVLADLVLWNRKSKLGKTFSPSTMFVLPNGEKRMPDAAWISLEKDSKLSKRQKMTFAHIVPDFIIEVRSPSDRLTDLQEKIQGVWMANGVRLAWLIDPVEKKARIYHADGSVEDVAGFDKKLSGGDVLPGFEFDLSVLKD